MSLDLHGLTIHQGWSHFNEEVDQAFWRGVRSMRVITGKGLMLHEFPTWASNHPKIQRIELNRDGGSFRVWLKKNA